MTPPWDVVRITEAVATSLQHEAQARDAEQAVYGIDVLDELQLHPLIQRGLRQAGFGVHPEQAYPSDRVRRRRKSEGKRCDIVLTRDDAPLLDPEAEQTLFGTDDAVPLDAACWLEVKTVSQFTVEGPFPRYSAELLQPVTRDIRKLAQDPAIFHAALLLVLFTADAAIATHDLAAWEQRALQRGYPVAPPIVRDFAITDRIGNAHLSVALFAVRRL